MTDFDLLDPDFYRGNPHDAWAWMREHQPVFHDRRNGRWGSPGMPT